MKRPVAGVHGWPSRVLLAFLVQSTPVHGHSASDAYLNLTVDKGNSTAKFALHGQWDIALRDLDFVLKLDDDGDGRLTWGEVRHHQASIEHYAYSHLHLNSRPGHACAIKPIRQMIDNHADGAYAALFFEVVCAGGLTRIGLDYTLFFAIDPSHRGIFVMNNGANAATAVLSPEHTEIELTLVGQTPQLP